MRSGSSDIWQYWLEDFSLLTLSTLIFWLASSVQSKIDPNTLLPICTNLCFWKCQHVICHKNFRLQITWKAHGWYVANSAFILGNSWNGRSVANWTPRIFWICVFSTTASIYKIGELFAPRFLLSMLYFVFHISFRVIGSFTMSLQELLNTSSLSIKENLIDSNNAVMKVRCLFYSWMFVSVSHIAYTIHMYLALLNSRFYLLHSYIISTVGCYKPPFCTRSACFMDLYFTFDVIFAMSPENILYLHHFCYLFLFSSICNFFRFFPLWMPVLYLIKNPNYIHICPNLFSSCFSISSSGHRNAWCELLLSGLHDWRLAQGRIFLSRLRFAEKTRTIT